MNFKRVSLFVVLMIFISALTNAEETPNPLDPRTNENANACYQGGSMDGRCQNALHWNAGWYLIRWEFMLMTREDVPLIYAWVLPPLKADGSDAGLPSFPSVGCVMSDSGLYVNFKGGYSLPPGSPIYTNAGCTNLSGFLTGDPGGTEFNLLYVPSSYDALTLCLASGGTSIANTSGNLVQCLL